MADIASPKQRSRNMSAIRSKNTKPEVYLRKLLFAEGYRYRIAPDYVPGHPDIFLRKYNTAIFVHGCFWHGHDCRNTRPSDNAEYWAKKRERNIRHDKEITALFEQRGWTVIRIWECELKKKNRDILLEKLTRLLQKNSTAIN